MKRRISAGRKIRPVFLVFCEGETEVEYVSLLKRKYRFGSISIKSKVKGLDIDQRFVESCKSTMGMKDGLNDKVFLMYDLDRQGVLPNLQRIRNANIVSSNPCIELWFLLHGQDQTAYLTTESCIQKLVSLIPDYEKGKMSKQLRTLLEAKTEQAVRRATGLKVYENPSSQVHRLIHELNKPN